MLHPYFRKAPERERCGLDRWLGPGWRLLERHELAVAAPRDAALAAVMGLRVRDLPVVRALLTLRGMRSSPGTTLREFFSTEPFVALEEEPGRELVAGVLVPARDPATGRRRRPDTPAGFRDACAAAPAAAIANFRADPAGSGSRLWTETWVRTRGPLASAAFGAYWLAIGPWSAWIRRMFLRAARRAA